jgi:hypothetical protein
MLKFAFAYSEPINKITGERSMKIRQYEIKDHEWMIVEQLRDCLKVRPFFFFHNLFHSLHLLDIQNSYIRILKRYTMCRQRHPCHGSNA